MAPVSPQTKGLPSCLGCTSRYSYKYSFSENPNLEDVPREADKGIEHEPSDTWKPVQSGDDWW